MITGVVNAYREAIVQLPVQGVDGSERDVDAVLDTGSMQYVFVDKGQGYFEPREVKVSARTENIAAIEKAQYRRPLTP